MRKSRAIFTFSRGLPFLWLFLSGFVCAQQKGVVEGRLVDKTNPAAVTGKVELEVVGLSGGMSILRSATTDASGKFRIDGLPLNEPLMIRANYQGANYHARLNLDSSGTAKVEIEVYQSTGSTEGVQVEGNQIAFEATGDQLKVLETISFRNKTNPPRTYVNAAGTIRFSKPAGILEPPKIRVTAPGSSMPIIQSALESPDGQSYYSQYPIRPGVTNVEIQQILPYSNRSYTYTKKFYQDVPSLTLGVVPRDMALSGQGLTRVETSPDKNFGVYTAPPVKAGSEVVWSFSGGTPVQETEAAGNEGDSRIMPVSTAIGNNALLIGPLLLAGLVLVLWYAFNHLSGSRPDPVAMRIRNLGDLRNQELDRIVALDQKYEAKELSRQEYVKEREGGKRQLRRMFLLMKKTVNSK
jgi:hypothetical protein